MVHYLFLCMQEITHVIHHKLTQSLNIDKHRILPLPTSFKEVGKEQNTIVVGLLVLLKRLEKQRIQCLLACQLLLKKMKKEYDAFVD